ncbi:replication factor C subunit 1-like [Tropilaelaps mercedesae]|uniref:Replication factor C subunit 1 n=1 Tax=Tropilaelaps mercedesae TaxID=418985 RepID=A0A1V9XQI6_9ACAR|nr:replication factor C subunit 1-like [Tropilaelaps mercedesae]
MDIRKFFGAAGISKNSLIGAKAEKKNNSNKEDFEDKKRKASPSKISKESNNVSKDLNGKPQKCSRVKEGGGLISPKKVAKAEKRPIETPVRQTSVKRKRPHADEKIEDKNETTVQADHAVEIQSTNDTCKTKKARQSQGANYMAYLNREPPRHLGERSHPQGSPNCLKGIVVVMTGVMDYVEKEEIRDVVERCGGRITGSVSGKTTHLIAGRDSGPTKVAKAESVGAQVLDELGWFAFVESKTDRERAFSPKKVVDPVEEMARSLRREEAEEQTGSVKKDENTINKRAEMMSPNKRQTAKSPSTKVKKEIEAAEYAKVPDAISANRKDEGPSLMWVDKYTPSNTKQVIGQQGDKSNVVKLRQWLTKWSTNAKPTFVGKFNRGALEGTGMKAALLSGSPGVGKTTTAHLVAKELQYEASSITTSVIELNASDTRSKRSLREEVATLLGNRTLSEKTRKNGHLLIMDEVDGMTGNEDRGGIAELIQLIKTTRVPIICICNDRSHPKMRSLVNYCFDLRFSKPQLKQIQAALMSICFKENVRLPPKVIEEIIIASNQDIRQCIHSLNLYCMMQNAKSTESYGKRNGSNQMKPIKDVRLGPFDVVKRLLVASEGGSKMNFNERQSLFFHDYNAIPLFVQENYVQVTPEPKVSKALFSTVLPSDEVRGSLRSMVNFPRWFGHHSSAGKHQRQAQALHVHMSCRISANTFETASNYMPLLNKRLVQPLIREGEEGVNKVVSVMSAYSLQRADMDAICELTTWGSASGRDLDPFQGVTSKVKAKLTRMLNKEVMLPYATDDMIKAGGKKIKKEPKKESRIYSEDNEDNPDDNEIFADRDASVAIDFM